MARYLRAVTPSPGRAMLSIAVIVPGLLPAVISRPAGSPGLPEVTYLGIPWTPLERTCHRLKTAASRRNPLRSLAKIQNVWSYGRRAARAARDYDLVYLH